MQVLSQEETQETMTMNNGYFFGLLDRMMRGLFVLSVLVRFATTWRSFEDTNALFACHADVQKLPDNSQKKDIMSQLEHINMRTNKTRQTVPNHAKQ